MTLVLAGLTVLFAVWAILARPGTIGGRTSGAAGVVALGGALIMAEIVETSRRNDELSRVELGARAARERARVLETTIWSDCNLIVMSSSWERSPTDALSIPSSSEALVAEFARISRQKPWPADITGVTAPEVGPRAARRSRSDYGGMLGENRFGLRHSVEAVNRVVRVSYLVSVAWSLGERGDRGLRPCKTCRLSSPTLFARCSECQGLAALPRPRLELVASQAAARRYLQHSTAAEIAACPVSGEETEPIVALSRGWFQAAAEKILLQLTNGETQ